MAISPREHSQESVNEAKMLEHQRLVQKLANQIQSGTPERGSVSSSSPSSTLLSPKVAGLQKSEETPKEHIKKTFFNTVKHFGANSTKRPQSASRAQGNSSKVSSREFNSGIPSSVLSGDNNQSSAREAGTNMSGGEFTPRAVSGRTPATFPRLAQSKRLEEIEQGLGPLGGNVGGPQQRLRFEDMALGHGAPVMQSSRGEEEEEEMEVRREDMEEYSRLLEVLNEQKSQLRELEQKQKKLIELQTNLENAREELASNVNKSKSLKKTDPSYVRPPPTAPFVEMLDELWKQNSEAPVTAEEEGLTRDAASAGMSVNSNKQMPQSDMEDISGFSITDLLKTLALSSSQSDSQASASVSASNRRPELESKLAWEDAKENDEIDSVDMRLAREEEELKEELLESERLKSLLSEKSKIIEERQKKLNARRNNQMNNSEASVSSSRNLTGTYTATEGASKYPTSAELKEMMVSKTEKLQELMKELEEQKDVLDELKNMHRDQESQARAVNEEEAAQIERQKNLLSNIAMSLEEEKRLKDIQNSMVKPGGLRQKDVQARFQNNTSFRSNQTDDASTKVCLSSSMTSSPPRSSSSKPKMSDFQLSADECSLIAAHTKGMAPEELEAFMCEYLEFLIAQRGMDGVSDGQEAECEDVNGEEPEAVDNAEIDMNEVSDIYKDVALFVAVNCERENYVCELFHELLHIDSDYAREKLLLAVREINSETSSQVRDSMLDSSAQPVQEDENVMEDEESELLDDHKSASGTLKRIEKFDRMRRAADITTNGSEVMREVQRAEFQQSNSDVNEEGVDTLNDQIATRIAEQYNTETEINELVASQLQAFLVNQCESRPGSVLNESVIKFLGDYVKSLRDEIAQKKWNEINVLDINEGLEIIDLPMVGNAISSQLQAFDKKPIMQNLKEIVDVVRDALCDSIRFRDVVERVERSYKVEMAGLLNDLLEAADEERKQNFASKKEACSTATDGSTISQRSEPEVESRITILEAIEEVSAEETFNESEIPHVRMNVECPKSVADGSSESSEEEEGEEDQNMAADVVDMLSDEGSRNNLVNQLLGNFMSELQAAHDAGEMEGIENSDEVSSRLVDAFLSQLQGGLLNKPSMEQADTPKNEVEKPEVDESKTFQER
eukprot:Nk52_evm16s96 gene=Nk52_evmTU16s96